MNRKRWKYVLEYVLGGGCLLAAAAIAWFVPEWYAGWQEQHLMGNVTLASREEIQFLDTDSLDVISRLKMMQESENLEGVMYDTVYLNVKDKMEECRNTAAEWSACGVVPGFAGEVISKEYLICACSFAIMNETNMIPLWFGRFDNGGDAVTVIGDMEKDMIYYISVSGERAESYMAQCLGYENAAALYQTVGTDAYLARREDLSAYDFAGICGAESAEVTEAAAGDLNLTAELRFDSFEGRAYRGLVCTEQGYGISIYFEMQNGGLPSLVEEAMSMWGYMEVEAWMEEWLKIGADEYRTSLYGKDSNFYVIG